MPQSTAPQDEASNAALPVVASRESPPGSNSPPVPPSDPRAALRATCKRLEVLSPDDVLEPLEAFKRADGQSQSMTEARGFGRCVEGPSESSGAWILRPIYLDTNETDLGPSLEGLLSLEFVSPRGEHFVDELAGGYQFEPLLIPADYGTNVDVSIAAVLDYDGDGTDEVVVSVEETGYDHHAFIWHIVAVHYDATARAQQDFYRPYEPSVDIEIDRVVDFDDDGRPDLLTQTMYWSSYECYGMSGAPPFGNPPVLFHATDQGTFDPSDEVAATFLREQCPKAPTRLLIADGDDWVEHSHERIACGRIWGLSAQEARVQVHEEWRRLRRSPEHVDACGDSIEPFVKTAAIDPPLVLTK